MGGGVFDGQFHVVGASQWAIHLWQELEEEIDHVFMTDAQGHVERIERWSCRVTLIRRQPNPGAIADAVTQSV